MSDTKHNGEDHDSAQIIRIACRIIEQAIQDGASEIRLEPDERLAYKWDKKSLEGVQRYLETPGGDEAVAIGPGLTISYNVAGVWREVMPLPDYVREPLTRRFKLMADMDLTRTKMPQEGRIPIRYADVDYVLSVQTKPTPQGERVEMQFATP